jgi:hypothetical protein
MSDNVENVAIMPRHEAVRNLLVMIAKDVGGETYHRVPRPCAQTHRIITDTQTTHTVVVTL